MLLKELLGMGLFNCVNFENSLNMKLYSPLILNKIQKHIHFFKALKNV